MYKIALSPEDRATNTYAVGNTNERDQMRRVADLLEAALIRCGFAVKNMQYGGMYDRVADGNAWGADLYIALHTNGFDGKVAGTRVHCYPSDKSRRIGRLIQDRIAPLSPGTSERLVESAGLYELKATHMPAVLPEFGFHDNPAEARWIIEHVELIAEETCHAVCDYFGAEYIAPAADAPAEEQPSDKLYRVQETVSVQLPLLRKGDKGAYVKSLQLLLNGKGCDCGKADGDFGVKTDSAVEKFQKDAKLTADKICGKDTWTALMGY